MRALLCAWAITAAPALAESPYHERPEVQKFIGELVERHGFVDSELEKVFARARREEAVLEAIQTPAEKVKPWRAYRATFLDERRVSAGAAFWAANRKTLERAERTYGVPAEYVVAIIGVETFYGRHTGKWRVVDVLTTLAFDYPPRGNFFRAELESYLLFVREKNQDVFSVRGSYAGAMGLPQFMPSSARRYAVDFDRDGKVDLRRSPADAIGSVANFLRQHGWRRGAEPMLTASVSGEAWRALGEGFEPRRPLEEWLAAGVELDKPPADPAAPATLVELATPGEPSDFRLGFRNFYVITRYNRSAFYATAVNDLAHELRARHPGKSPAKKKPAQSAGK